MSEWRSIELGGFIELKRGYDLPSRLRESGPYPLMSSSGESDTHIEPKVAGPGVVTGRYGTIGNVFYVSEDFWPLNTTLYVRDFKGNDPRFTYYFLQTLDWNKFNDKSGVPGVNRNDAHREPVVVPEVNEQKAIAAILGALDDKIALNQRMNETLEGLARATFKSWFVDFDPVCAKAEGRDTGLAPDLAALFPDRFSADGLPEGWELKPVGSDIELKYGKALREVDRVMGPIDVYGSNGLIGKHDESLVQGPGIIVGRKGNPGIVTYSSTDFFPIDTTFYVVPKRNMNAMIYWWLALDGVGLSSYGSDSAVPGLNRDMAHSIEWVSPDCRAIEVFNKSCSPLVERMALSLSESQTLAALRDLLLPKLMSGETPIKNAEKLIGEAGA